MARLPSVGGDNGQWGQILNDYLSVEHNTDGTLKKASDIAAAQTNATQALSDAAAAASAANSANAAAQNAQSTANSKYSKPNTGIPESDLDASVQSKLSAAQTGTPDASTTVKGKVQLAGDLTGTASSPQITAGAITDAKIAIGANIGQAKIQNLPADLAAKYEKPNNGIPASDLTASIQSAILQAGTAEQASNKGQAGGYASLDGGGKVPASQLPSAIMRYQGVWDANANNPMLVDGSGESGDVYRVTTAGTQNLGTGPLSFEVGDYAVYNPSGIWEKSDTTDSVASVAGKTGIITLDKADVGLGNVQNVDTTLRANHTGTQSASTISDFSTAADARITLQKGQAGGVATLDGTGKIPGNQLPALAITNTFSVNSQAAQLALSAQEGDLAIRTDEGKTYVHNGGTANSMADWSELLTVGDQASLGTKVSKSGDTMTGPLILNSSAYLQGGSYITAYNGLSQQVAIGRTAPGVPNPGLTFGDTQDTNIYRFNANILATDDRFLVNAGSGTIGLSVRTVNDTNDRFYVGANGTLNWGSGSAVPDTNLYRSAANVLKTDDLLAFNAASSDKINLYDDGSTFHGLAVKSSEMAFIVPSTTHLFGFYNRVSGTDTRTASISGAGAITGTSLTSSGTVNVPRLESYQTSTGTNYYYQMSTNAGTFPAFSSVPKYLWHDNLRFNRWTGTPAYETYNGTTWSTQTLDRYPFSGKDGGGITLGDGVTVTGARWTWNSGNFQFGYALWWCIGFPYVGATNPNRTVTIESSANGTTWTTRHSSSNVIQNGGPVWFFQNDNGSDQYIRLTITVTNGQPLAVNAIKALSSRWGNQGGGSEYEFPYDWDNDRKMTIGTTTGARSNGVLNIAGTNPTSASDGIYFGTDVNLYRSAANTLKTDNNLIASSYTGGVVTGNALLATNLAANNRAFGTQATGDTSYAFEIDNRGRMNWGAGAGSVDVNLYRQSASNLKTDGNMRVGNGVVAKDGAAEQVTVGYVALGKAGLILGLGADVTLYRDTTDVLKTDDSLRVARSLVPGVVTLTDAATISIDASLGNIFKVTLAGNRTIAAPTNPTDGQTIFMRIKQDATGSRTVTWNAAFRFSVDVPAPTLSTAANATDYLEFMYESTDAKWDCLNVRKGY